MTQHDTDINNKNSDMPRHDNDSAGGQRRVTVEDAAKLLGLSENAVRKRIERGSLASERINGTRYVLLDDIDMSKPDTGIPSEAYTLIYELRDRVRYLEEESARKDAILLSLSEGLKALSPPSEPRESSVSSSEGPGSSSTRPNEGQPQRSFLRRFFGL